MTINQLFTKNCLLLIHEWTEAQSFIILFMLGKLGKQTMLLLSNDGCSVAVRGHFWHSTRMLETKRKQAQLQGQSA